MKKWTLLCILLTALLAAGCACAASSGNLGDNIAWDLNDSGTLTLSGSGAMPGFEIQYDLVYDEYYTTAPWGAERKSIRSAVIETGITGIGSSAFSGCTFLTSVSIPGSVTAIGSSAFSGCTGLTGITVPDSVTSIGSSAFSGCAGLRSISLPDSVTGIGSSAFDGCTGLTGSIAIPDGVTLINSSAFRNCWRLTGVTFPDGVRLIDENAFSGCTGLTGITLPADLVRIGNSAFSGCTGLNSLTLPAGIVKIGNRAFSGCTGLTGSIAVPDGTTDIGEAAFPDGSVQLTAHIGSSGAKALGKANYRFRCGDHPGLLFQYLYDNGELIGLELIDADNDITSAVIPDGVTRIGSSAFAGCTGLTGSITLPDSVTEIGEGAFSNCPVRITARLGSDGARALGSAGYSFFCEDYPGLRFQETDRLSLTGVADKSVASVVIPDIVTGIGNYAFRDCTALTGITIPDSITSIGKGVFSGCTGLIRVIIPDNVTSVSADAFSGVSNVFVRIGSNTARAVSAAGGSYCSEECPGFRISETDGLILAGLSDWTMTSVTIPDIFTGIGYRALAYMSRLTSVTIPDSVTTIAREAFRASSALQTVRIPDSLTSIGDLAFYDCDPELYASVGSEGAKALSRAGYSFRCEGYPGIKLKYAYANGEITGLEVVGSDKTITSAVIPSGVTCIAKVAFHYCKELTSVTIPNTVTRIENLAFGYCDKLTDITIPNSVTRIGDSAFVRCISLTGITVPDSVTSLSSNVFSQCTGLKSVKLSNSIPSIGYRAFYLCTALTSVTIPDSVTRINSYAFDECTALTSITIPDGVTAIEERTFRSCTALRSITIPVSVTSVGTNAFVKCSSLKNVFYAGAEPQARGISIADGNTRLTGAVWHYDGSGYQPVTIVTQPQDTEVQAAGKTATVTVSAAGDGLEYQWYLRNRGKTLFSKSSVTAAEYSVSMTEASDGRQVYCVVSDKYGNSVQSNTVTLSISDPLAITVQPKTVRVSAAGITARTSVTATGRGLTYQWYVKNPGGASFQKSSVTQSAYSVKITEENSGRQIYCVVTDYYGETVQSATVVLSIKKELTITTQPKSVRVKPGETAKVTVKATGDGVKYQWYLKDPDKSAFSKSSVTTSSYSVQLTDAKDGRQLYCVVSDEYGNQLHSKTVTLTQEHYARITTQPKSVRVKPGGTAKVTVKATGDGLKYQWYLKDPGKSAFAKSSITASTYSVQLTDARDGRQLYCAVTDQYGNTVQTRTVTLTQEHYARITTQPKSVTVKAGETAKVTVKAAGDGLTYQWYLKDPDRSAFAKSSVTASVYTVQMTAAKSGRKVYCVVTDQYGNTVQTKTVTLTVQ